MARSNDLGGSYVVQLKQMLPEPLYPFVLYNARAPLTGYPCRPLTASRPSQKMPVVEDTLCRAVGVPAPLLRENKGRILRGASGAHASAMACTMEIVLFTPLCPRHLSCSPLVRDLVQLEQVPVETRTVREKIGVGFRYWLEMESLECHTC